MSYSPSCSCYGLGNTPIALKHNAISCVSKQHKMRLGNGKCVCIILVAFGIVNEKCRSKYHTTITVLDNRTLVVNTRKEHPGYETPANIREILNMCYAMKLNGCLCPFIEVNNFRGIVACPACGFESYSRSGYKSQNACSVSNGIYVLKF